MPANAGRKPGYQHRDRNTTEPDTVVDCIEKSTSGNSQHRTTSSTISLSDLRAIAGKEFELHHRTNLLKSVSKRQEHCSRPIKVEEVMVVRSKKYIFKNILTQRHMKTLRKQTKHCCRHWK